jgi:hypothetical protein
MDGIKNGQSYSNGHVLAATSNGDVIKRGEPSTSEKKQSCLQKISSKIISILEGAFYRLVSYCNAINFLLLLIVRCIKVKGVKKLISLRLDFRSNFLLSILNLVDTNQRINFYWKSKLNEMSLTFSTFTLV